MADTDIVFTAADDLREALILELLHESFLAQREVPKVGTREFPTPWDNRHEELNALITDLEEIGF